MVADGTWDAGASVGACQSASDRLLTWSGHELSDGSDESRTHLKLALTSAAPTSK